MTHTIGVELIPLMERLNAVLDAEPSGVRQQQAIELLTVRHALRMGEQAHYVAKSMHKHVQQLLEQQVEYEMGQHRE